VVPTLWLLETPHAVNLVVVGVLAILTMTNVQFAHPVRVVQWRAWNMAAITCWVLGVLFATLASPDVPALLIALTVLGPLMIFTATTARAVNNMTSKKYA
jgi:hypothetical protein